MNYWHLQMFMPEGRKGIKINSIEMLQREKPVIGTGEWNNPQCSNFKKAMQIGDIVCVKEGSKILALCKITSNSFTNTDLKDIYYNHNYRQVQVLDFYQGDESFPQPQGTLQRAINSDTPTWQFIDQWYQKYVKTTGMKEIINLLQAKKQIILQGPPGTGKTYLAKKMAKILVGEGNDKQWKLVQFHPSYTYEDFVRGISANSDPEGKLIYETENKVLAKFAEKAAANFDDTKKTPAELSKIQWVQDQWQQFVEKVEDELELNNLYKVNESVSLTSSEEGSFKYTGHNWAAQNHHGMKHADIIEGYLENVQSRKEYKMLDKISGSAKQHASYFYKVLEKFRQSIKEPYKAVTNKEQNSLKNYVLIIDEINRANLPSVLGELIYALEYRGEAVESMYAIDGDNSIVIPPNLYIIGTMNTADRSVGHIDYAIKRRFAFVDVLPSDEVIEDPKAKELFKRVAALFVDPETGENSEYLATDFDHKEVQLGHSYFLVKNGDEQELKMRLTYEILPILNEYVKDGLLLTSAKAYITENIENFV